MYVWCKRFIHKTFIDSFTDYKESLVKITEHKEYLVGFGSCNIIMVKKLQIPNVQEARTLLWLP